MRPDGCDATRLTHPTASGQRDTPHSSRNPANLVHEPPSHPLSPGTTIAQRYRLESGLGGSGVFAALDLHTGGRVALKVAPARQAAARLDIEARCLQRISHPGVVALLDHGRDGNTTFLATTLLPGPTLEQLRSTETRLSWRRAVELVVAVCDAVSAVHAAHVLHCDIKPANLVLDDHGRPVLVDLGSAVLLDDPTAAMPASYTTYTCAPEQAAGHPATPATDVYGLAATLYRLVSGVHVFAQTNPAVVLRNKLQKAPLSLQALVPGVPDALDAAVLDALQTDPRARTPSPAAFAAALQACLDAAPA